MRCINGNICGSTGGCPECMPKNFPNSLIKLTDLQAENEKLKEWYDSIMEFGVNSYYKCGSCGGPVKAGLCCAWCGAKDPQALKGD